MDQTRRPFEMPQAFSTYADKHQLYKLFQTLVEELIVLKPEDPLQHMIQRLEVPVDIANLPKIIVNGPPCGGRYSLSRMLSEELRCVHIVPSALPDATGGQLGGEARKMRKQEQGITPQMWAKLIFARVTEADCMEKGWVMNGYPNTYEEAVALQLKGVLPHHYVSLQCTPAVLRQRQPGKRIDPRTGDVYNTVFGIPPNPDVERRLVKDPECTAEKLERRLESYKIHQPIVEELYKNLHRVDGDQSVQLLHKQVLETMKKPQRVNAPRTPRIILLGPLASGKSCLAEELARKYKIVNICSDELVKQEIAAATATGRAMQPFLNRSAAVPDELILKVLRVRLNQPDSQARGWVMHGFPKTGNQADMLEKNGYVPDRIMSLKITEKTAVERLSQRRVDTVTGIRYDLSTTQIPSEEIAKRLKRQPQDDPDVIRKTYRKQSALLEDVLDYYADRATHVKADDRLPDVFHKLEAVLLFPPGGKA